MKTLITGASGFVGQHLIKLYPGADVFAPGGKHVDITDYEQVLQHLDKHVPEVVIHLAAQSSVPLSFQNPELTFDVNFRGTYHLLKALKQVGFKGRFLFVGSGDMYGLVAEENLPVSELQPLRPRNPYAVSKVAAESLCYQWSQTENFDIMMARSFNHTGPGQTDLFAVPSFAKQIIEIKMEKRESQLLVGDLAVTRDFTDVRDVVRAYQNIVEHGENGNVYNVCSGNELYLSDIIKELMSLADVRADIVRDPHRYRPAEQKRVFGDNQKIRDTLNWQPQISLADTLNDILNHWTRELT